MPADDSVGIVAALEPGPLDLGKALVDGTSPECGGVASFIGTVRSSSAVEKNSERQVIALEYEAHPELAVERLREIAHEASGRWDLRRVVAVHRVGRCDLSEPTVVIVCGAPHRADALEACRFIIDTVKGTVPIWKREIYEDGSDWVGQGS